MNKLRFFITLIGFAVSTLTQAETAHQHGVGTLNIAASQQDLMLELQTPADNILGFEHSPRTDQQKQQLSNSLELLKKADLLFNMPMQAKCSLQNVEIENPFAFQEIDEKHEEHEEQKEHDEHDSLDKADEHDHSQEASDTHTDFTINYTYRCEQAKQLASINIAGLFKHFSNFETLNVQWVHNNKQSAKTVTKKDMIINFNN